MMKNIRASELLDLLKNSYEDLFYNSKNKKEKKKFFSFIEKMLCAKY